jgi:rod shape-determining protein MreC
MRPGGVLAVILAALAVLLVLLLRAPLGDFLWRILSPALAARGAFGGQTTTLEAELASTTAALAAAEPLFAENAELRSELGRAQGARLVLAGVLEHPPGTPYDTLVLDAGSSQGVAVGDKVVASGFALGVIDTAYDGTSRAVLYSSPGQTYQAYIAAKGGSLPISFEGQGGGSMRGQLPQGSVVEVGDAVVLPGAAEGMTATVAAVDAPAGESFVTVYAQVPFNLFNLKLVYIRI